MILKLKLYLKITSCFFTRGLNIKNLLQPASRITVKSEGPLVRMFFVSVMCRLTSRRLPFFGRVLSKKIPKFLSFQPALLRRPFLQFASSLGSTGSFEIYARKSLGSSSGSTSAIQQVHLQYEQFFSQCSKTSQL